MGLIIAFFQFILPILTEEKKELTYSVSSPISLIDDGIITNLDIKINGVNTQQIFSNQIVIENTGQIPLINTPVSIIFQNSDSSFVLYNSVIETFPKYEFGNIDIKKSKNKIRLVVELLNPDDRILLSLLTNKNSIPTFYSKIEGMVLSEHKPDKKDESILSIILAIVASGLSIILLAFSQSKGYISFDLNGVKINFDMLYNAKSESGLKILFATYGKGDKIKDVALTLNKMIQENQLRVIANNKIFGDAVPNIKKELKVVYSIGKDINTIRIKEDEILELPVKATSLSKKTK